MARRNTKANSLLTQFEFRELPPGGGGQHVTFEILGVGGLDPPEPKCSFLGGGLDPPEPDLNSGFFKG
eukprot:1189372-Prorocentrum_minimum.AAC.2